jgi:hypothetical protein
MPRSSKTIKVLRQKTSNQVADHRTTNAHPDPILTLLPLLESQMLVRLSSTARLPTFRRPYPPSGQKRLYTKTISSKTEISLPLST